MLLLRCIHRPGSGRNQYTWQHFLVSRDSAMHFQQAQSSSKPIRMHAICWIVQGGHGPKFNAAKAEICIAVNMSIGSDVILRKSKNDAYIQYSCIFHIRVCIHINDKLEFSSRPNHDMPTWFTIISIFMYIPYFVHPEVLSFHRFLWQVTTSSSPAPLALSRLPEGHEFPLFSSLVAELPRRPNGLPTVQPFCSKFELPIGPRQMPPKGDGDWRVKKRGKM